MFTRFHRERLEMCGCLLDWFLRKPAMWVKDFSFENFTTFEKEFQGGECTILKFPLDTPMVQPEKKKAPQPRGKSSSEFSTIFRFKGLIFEGFRFLDLPPQSKECQWQMKVFRLGFPILKMWLASSWWRLHPGSRSKHPTPKQSPQLCQPQLCHSKKITGNPPATPAMKGIPTYVAGW